MLREMPLSLHESGQPGISRSRRQVSTTDENSIGYYMRKEVCERTAALLEVAEGVGGVAGPVPMVPGCWRIRLAFVTSCCVSESKVATWGLYLLSAVSSEP